MKTEKSGKTSVEVGRKYQKTAKNVSKRETRGVGNRGPCYRSGAKHLRIVLAGALPFIANEY